MTINQPTPAHRCDPHIGSGDGGGPVTLARTLRLLLAYVDDGDFDGNAQPVVDELGACLECWWAALAGMTGVAASLMPEHGPHVVRAFDAHLAVALDQIAREGDR